MHHTEQVCTHRSCISKNLVDEGQLSRLITSGVLSTMPAVPSAQQRSKTLYSFSSDAI